MCLEELGNITIQAGLPEDEHFGSSIVPFAFNKSMML
jgi:hypothetical protein